MTDSDRSTERERRRQRLAEREERRFRPPVPRISRSAYDRDEERHSVRRTLAQYDPDDECFAL